ncbi:MAG: carboxypeptidase M32 [Nitrospirota bacterium]|nr:carboxypeptidase M32 [Nitrospirota bacterium]
MESRTLGIMDAILRQLRDILSEINALEGASHVLTWDQFTYMPTSGASARGRQASALKRVIHEKSTSADLGKLLDAAANFLPQMDPDSDDASLIRVARRDFERASRVPDDFVERFSSHTSVSYMAWAEARAADDFSVVAPFLQRSIDLSREYSGFFPGAAHVADPLIEHSDPGMSVATIGPLFGELHRGLLPIVRDIAARSQPEDGFLYHHYPKKRQIDFGAMVARRFGYDFERGRQDMALHPFSITLGVDDVRITTRVKEDDLWEGLSSTLHEAGHGMYEQGIDVMLDGTPLASGASSGVHESQSRLWENLVARSLPFWECFFPLLQKQFPESLQGVSVDAFYRAINRVEPTFIRTDSDEVTYNLHVMLRFDLEVQLLEGKLSVHDLPEAWNERMHQDLGVCPESPNYGVLQDVHWYCDHVGGAFQGYTLGNLMSAQFFAAALRDHPEISAEMALGRFNLLHGWLTRKIYRHGRKFSDDKLVLRATGQPLTVTPFLDYLKNKYSALYGLAANA